MTMAGSEAIGQVKPRSMPAALAFGLVGIGYLYVGRPMRCAIFVLFPAAGD